MDKLLEAFRLLDEVFSEVSQDREIGSATVKQLEKVIKTDYDGDFSLAQLETIRRLQLICEKNLDYTSGDYEYFVSLMQMVIPDYDGQVAV